MHIEVAGLTHVGMRRNHNEDSFLLLPARNLLCVADGMGGHASGEVASQVAVETMASYFERAGQDQRTTLAAETDATRTRSEARLLTAFQLANQRIFEIAESNARHNKMGTTLAALYFAQDELVIGHVGDSRAYRFRDGVLSQLTEDHSLLNECIRRNQLSEEDIARFPYKNVILRALGVASSVQVDVRREEARPGDTFLVCTDGLSGMVPSAQIAETLGSGTSLEDMARSLVEQANAAGGDDNVTVVLARVPAR